MFKPKSPSKKKKSTSKNEATLTLKEQLAIKRKKMRERQELISFASKTIGIGLLLGLILFLAAGIKAAIPGVLGVIVMGLSYKYPRQALIGFIIYVPFGGTITYYIGNSPILQLAKDAFYIPAAIGLFQNLQKQRLPLILPQGIKTPLFILLGCCGITFLLANVAQQFNPPPVKPFAAPTKEFPIGMGILGLKVLLGYLPFISCTYYMIRNKRDFLMISRFQIILILSCCVLGLIQYIFLLTGICEGTDHLTGADLFKATLDARCYFGGSLVYSPSQGMIRLPGTFVAPWQWAWFLISSTFFTFATGFSDPSLLWRFISLGSMAMVFINAAISGQRIALALVPTCFVLQLILTGQVANLKQFVPIFGGLVVLLGGAIVSNPTIIQERLDSFISRWNASPPYAFITEQFHENLKSVAGPFGSGLGRATNSARAMGETKLVETYYPKLIYEIGIVGMIAFLLLVTILTIICWQTTRKIKNRNFRSYASSMWVFILFISYNTYYYPLDVDPVAVYYWLAAGILLKLPEIDKLEAIEAARVQAIEEQDKKSKSRSKRKMVST